MAGVIQVGKVPCPREGFEVFKAGDHAVASVGGGAPCRVVWRVNQDSEVKAFKVSCGLADGYDCDLSFAVDVRDGFWPWG